MLQEFWDVKMCSLVNIYWRLDIVFKFRVKQF